MLFIGVYLWAQPMYPPYFDPVVLPERDYWVTEDHHHRDKVVVNVLKDGRYMLNGEDCSPARLTMLLQRLAVMHPDADGLSTIGVKIRADYRVPWKAVNRVLDICWKARIWRVSFGVRVKGGYW
jgi:biopolymer transport protein ExbD